MKKDINVKKILMLQSAVFIYSLGSVLSKLASIQLAKSGLFSFELIAILFLMVSTLGIYAIVWQKMLKTTDLTVAYANKGMLLFWSLLWTVLFFKEVITIYNVIGVILIVIGILVVTNND